MLRLTFVLTLSLTTFVCTLPLNDSHHEENVDPIDDLFAQLNDKLKDDINDGIGNKTVEVGKNYTTEHGGKGQISISIQKFSFGNDNFPVTFEANNDSNADGKEITPLKGDFESSAVYLVKREDEDDDVDDESSETATVLPCSADSFTEIIETETEFVSDEDDDDDSSSIEEKKLVKEAEKQPILTNV